MTFVVEVRASWVPMLMRFSDVDSRARAAIGQASYLRRDKVVRVATRPPGQFPELAGDRLGMIA
jgi:hypothetical protein